MGPGLPRCHVHRSVRDSVGGNKVQCFGGDGDGVFVILTGQVQIAQADKKDPTKIMGRFTVATLVMAVALFTACDGDSTGNGGSIVGTYTLQIFNGESLPAQLGPTGPVGPGGTMTIFALAAGSLQLNSGNTCSLSLTFSETETDAMGNVTVTTDTQTETCTYSVTGTTIRLDSPGQASVTGTISGNTITFVDEDGDTFVFTK